MPSSDDVYDHFHVRDDGSDVGPQYASLYHCRAQQLAPRAVVAANRAWGPPSDASRWTNAIDAQTADTTTEVRLVGILYRRMDDPRIESRALKGTIDQTTELVRTRRHADDSLKLEDAAGRLALRIDERTGIDAARLPSGCVVAVRGRYVPFVVAEQGVATFQHDAGALEVFDVRMPGLHPHPHSNPHSSLHTGRCVVIVSGLSIRGKDLSVEMEALLAGLVANATDGRIAHVLVAGNGAAPWEPDAGGGSTVVAHLSGLDHFLAELAAHVPVDYMCGPDDVGPRALPQPPLFRSLLPNATMEKGLRLCTNPCVRTIEGFLFVGSSGQPVDDARDHLPPPEREAGDASLRVLSTTLECAHMAPTAPGTLHCHAYVHEDPFVLRARPHVYFAGNQPAGNDRLDAEHGGAWTRTVVVPRFTDGSTVVAIRLEEGCPCDFVTVGGE